MDRSADAEQPQPDRERVDAPTFWEERYQAGEAGWDVGAPAAGFVTWLRGPHAPAPGRVAVLGAGSGQDALLFARAGHDVVGFDFAPSAVAQARALARDAGVAARFEQADFFALPPEYTGTFDVVVENAFFTAIAPRRRAEYAATVCGL